MSAVQFQVQGLSLLLAPCAVQGEYWLFKQQVRFTRGRVLMSPVHITL